jgi:hypothetical protein
MYTGQTVFSQIMDFVPKYEFQNVCYAIMVIIKYKVFPVGINFYVWPLLK